MRVKRYGDIELKSYYKGDQVKQEDFFTCKTKRHIAKTAIDMAHKLLPDQKE